MKKIITTFLFVLNFLLPKAQTPDTVCYNSTNSTYLVTNTPGYTYTWSIAAPGILVSGQGTNQIQVDWVWANQGLITNAVTVFATNSYGCPGPPLSIDVYIQCAKASSIFYPNAFTPNGDGINDGWSPITFKIIQIKWQIYNRWGQKVFECFDIGKKWDGRYLSVPQPMSNFVFQCWWRGADNRTGYNKGNLILIR